MRHDPNFIIEDFYLTHKTIAPLFKKLVPLCRQLNFKEIPAIAMALTYELGYKIDHFRLWETIVDQCNKSLHQFTIVELIKIRFATACTYPKVGNPLFHRKILDLVSQELHVLQISELLHAMYAFRHLKQDLILSKIMAEITSRKKQIKSADMYGQTLYTFAISQIPEARNYQKKREMSNKQMAEKVVDTFLGDILNAVAAMTAEGLVLMSLGLLLLRTESYGDVLLRVQTRVLQLIEQQPDAITAKHAYHLVYAFGKMNLSQGFGSDLFYQRLYTYIQKHWESYSNLEKSRIFYSYSHMQQLSGKELEVRFLPWVRQGMPQFRYNELHHILFGLMYNNITEKEIWKQFVHNVCSQQLVVPIVNYFPVKLSKYYMKMLFPKWNLQPFDQACHDAEVHFNIMRTRNSYQTKEFNDLCLVLYKKFEVNVKLLLEYENLFIIDFVILPQKVAIMQQTKRFSHWNSSAPLPIFQLKCRILENEGWKVVPVNWQEFLSETEDQSARLLKSIEDAFKIQDNSYRTNYFDQYKRVFDKISQFGERLTFPAKRNMKVWDDEIDITQPKAPEGQLKLTDEQKEVLNSYIEMQSDK